MKMRENMQDIKRLFASNETLLRLLYYKPANYNDNPLDPAKPNILDMSEDDKWAIINDVIKTTEVVDDLDNKAKCRILFYSGTRNPQNDNYLVADQEIVFDVIVHIKGFDEVDMRLSWICDYINELVSGKKVTGIGKFKFVTGHNVPAPNYYVAYRLVYEYGSGSE